MMFGIGEDMSETGKICTASSAVRSMRVKPRTHKYLDKQKTAQFLLPGRREFSLKIRRSKWYCLYE